jgi:hypothetical protein
VCQKNPNPQGKGIVPVLRDWATMNPSTAGSKSATIFLRDYCLSSLVLAAKFRFKPVLGKSYFLYARGHDWMLSLIAPHEWGQREYGAFLGECCLRPDMTWEIQTAGDCAADELALEKAQNFVREFVDTLVEQDTIVEHLPFYVSELPYYQRLLSTALASSLQRTLPAGGQDLKLLLGNAREWLLSATP